MSELVTSCELEVRANVFHWIYTYAPHLDLTRSNTESQFSRILWPIQQFNKSCFFIIIRHNQKTKKRPHIFFWGQRLIFLSYVITQGICNKFIEIIFCVGRDCACCICKILMRFLYDKDRLKYCIIWHMYCRALVCHFLINWCWI